MTLAGVRGQCSVRHGTRGCVIMEERSKINKQQSLKKAWQRGGSKEGISAVVEA